MASVPICMSAEQKRACAHQEIPVLEDYPLSLITLFGDVTTMRAIVRVIQVELTHTTTNHSLIQDEEAIKEIKSYVCNDTPDDDLPNTTAQHVESTPINELIDVPDTGLKIRELIRRYNAAISKPGPTHKRYDILSLLFPDDTDADKPIEERFIANVLKMDNDWVLRVVVLWAMYVSEKLRMAVRAKTPKAVGDVFFDGMPGIEHTAFLHRMRVYIYGLASTGTKPKIIYAPAVGAVEMDTNEMVYLTRCVNYYMLGIEPGRIERG